MKGCWEWTRYITNVGYGQLCYRGRTYSAHRFFYETCFGPVPKGLQLDHLCRNRWCCNPDHMEAVTPVENIRRGLLVRAVRTHCPKGHEFTEENTYKWKPVGSRRPEQRQCRSCDRARHREYYRRKSRYEEAA